MERMGRRESRSEKSMDDFYRNIGLDPEQLAQPSKTVMKKAETATVDEPSGETPEDMVVPQKRVSSKQRRLSLDEYRTAYLQVPKITDASLCSSAVRCVTGWMGLSAVSAGVA